MIGKHVQYVVWEYDRISNDEISRSGRLEVKGDVITTGGFAITEKMFEKGADIGDSESQNYFIEVLPYDVSAYSKRFGVSSDGLMEVEKVKSAAVVKKQKKAKERFDKVVGLGKEAVLYITSEMATEIKVDNNGKIISYPDYGGYNNMNEYKEGEKIYCKKLPNGTSAFPLYKTYIYRGNKVDEAIKRLKQDIENKTYENAESTILTVARHAQSNNKDYGNSGPIPPNTINKLYRIRYMHATNTSGKESFRYRFVDDNTSNLPLKDLKLEVSSGAMILGRRGSISIDPWKSKDLIGCLGIRNSDGANHSSCADKMTSENIKSKTEYKFIYHALNNYLETIIPELTGVYGRRGYSSNGKVTVKASDYKEEIKVFALVDPLPELNKKDDKLFNLEDANRALRLIYDNYGKEIAQNVEMMYRWECSHFRSGQYKHCGGPGMEAANNTHPTYGWNGEMYKKFSQYTPVGLWDAFENPGMSGKGGNTQVTDRKKRYVQFPSVEAGMVYVAEFLVRHNGNIGRWHTTDVSRQPDYVKNINTTVPRIVNSFK